MRTIKYLITTVLIAALCITAFGACSGGQNTKPDSGQNTKLESGDITKDNLAAVCDILNAAGLSNVDTFEAWVQGYLNGDADGGDSSGFTDADCRMTVMLLAGDHITANSVDESYDGTYLMFDLEAIRNQEDFAILQDKEQLFTTLFGEMDIPESGFQDAFANNTNEHGIQFGGEDYSVISLIFKAYDEDYAFVGHTGLLIDCRDAESVDANYLFVEKIAFNDSYKITTVNSEEELMSVLAERPDYAPEEGAPNPLVYKNGELLGELQAEKL